MLSCFTLSPFNSCRPRFLGRQFRLIPVVIGTCVGRLGGGCHGVKTRWFHWFVLGQSPVLLGCGVSFFVFQFYGLVVDGTQCVGFEALYRYAFVTIDSQHLGAYGRQQHFRIFPAVGFLPGIAQQLIAVGNKPLAVFLSELHFLCLFSFFEHALLFIVKGQNCRLLLLKCKKINFFSFFYSTFVGGWDLYRCKHSRLFSF